MSWLKPIYLRKRKEKMNKQKLLLSLSAIILMSLSVTACETMEGAGRDIEDGGEAIQRAAN